MVVLKSTVVLVAALAVTTAGVEAQREMGYQGWGPRFGLTADPDQVHFGAHLDLGDFTDHFRFQPNVELGVGDGLTVFTVNGEVDYRFFTASRWSPYLGGSIGMNVVSDDDRGVLDDSDSELGLSALGGFERRLSGSNLVAFEAKVGLIDSPDLKFTVAWTFH
jgi:hypothetical protein